MAETITGSRRPDWTTDVFAEFKRLADRSRGGDANADQEAVRFILAHGVPDWPEIFAERDRHAQRKTPAG